MNWPGQHAIATIDIAFPISPAKRELSREANQINSCQLPFNQ